MQGQKLEARAAREVIVSAGAIASPQLLSHLGRQPAVRLLREHAEGRRVDAAALDARKRKASCVLPEFVGPRWAITVSGSVVRSGSRTVKSAVDLRGGGSRLRCRSARLGRF